MWHQRVSLPYPRFRTRCTQRTRHGRSRFTGPPRGGHLMISPLCICRRCGRDGRRGRCRRAGMQGQERNRGGYTVLGYVSQVWEEVWEVSGADAAAAAAATTRAFWVRYYGGSALRAAARWWRGAERAGGRRRGVGVFESSAGVRPCVSRWSVSARHDRACSMAVESPKCWQRGVVRLVERLPGQGARAGCAQDGHTRPRTRVAVALARSGPPASTASEASRGPFLVRGERGERFFSPGDAMASISFHMFMCMYKG